MRSTQGLSCLTTHLNLVSLSFTVLLLSSLMMLGKKSHIGVR